MRNLLTAAAAAAAATLAKRERKSFHHIFRRWGEESNFVVSEKIQ
jgi:hypothetical protein